MKYIYLLLFLSISTACFSQEEQGEWIKTEGEIMEITSHRGGKKIRETATVKFNLENGTEQLGSIQLFRIPFIGSMYSVGDKITMNYKKSNPAISETNLESFLSNYGMYILIFLGIIFSAKSLLKVLKGQNKIHNS